MIVIHTIANMLSIVQNCCEHIFGILPNSQLPFIPALVCGILTSFFFMIVLYKKKFKDKSIQECISCLFRDLFITIPGTNHCAFDECNIPGCPKCQKENGFFKTIVSRWQKIEDKNQEKYLRVCDAIENLSFDLKSKEKNSAKKLELKMDLPPNKFWTDFDCFEIEKELLKLNYTIIYEEFDTIFQDFQLGNINGWKLKDIKSGHWCVFSIIKQGKIDEENCTKCPNTAALLGNFPSLMKDCLFGNAFFSLLYPDSYIDTHKGPTNIRLRCNFGLRIPNDCYLEVDGTQISWLSKDSIIFDDNLEHSEYFAHNDSFEIPRVVLVLDLWHPSIDSTEKEVLLDLLDPNLD